MNLEKVVFISYSQICVFDSTLEAPFNPWSDEDVARYFAESDRSVSFRTEQESANYNVELADVERHGSKDGLIRCIEASLTIPAEGSIEVASISDGFRIAEPTSGKLKVRFEEYEGLKIRLTLFRQQE